MLQGVQFQTQFLVNRFVTWNYDSNDLKYLNIPASRLLLAQEILPELVIPDASLMTVTNT